MIANATGFVPQGTAQREGGITREQIEALRDAMMQVLDDFGRDGKSVCGATKAEARVAIEPFLNEEIGAPDYSFEEAKNLLASLS